MLRCCEGKILTADIACSRLAKSLILDMEAAEERRKRLKMMASQSRDSSQTLETGKEYQIAHINAFAFANKLTMHTKRDCSCTL